MLILEERGSVSDPWDQVGCDVIIWIRVNISPLPWSDYALVSIVHHTASQMFRLYFGIFIHLSY